MAELVDEKNCGKIMEQIGVDPEGISIMLPKCRFRRVLVRNVRNAIANIIKQTMLSVGGDVAVHRGCVNCTVEKSDILLMGTVKQLRILVRAMQAQPAESKHIAEQIEKLLD